MTRYRSLYERLVATTVLEHEDNPQSCWLHVGHVPRSGYPRICIRTEEGPRNREAHRVMLEEVHDATFPHDEGGHLCGNTLCRNPDHLEVQTRAHNTAEQRSHGHVNLDKSWIPVLYPRSTAEDDIPF